ncbi:hypothetical protein EDC04DRAFT_2670018 [Pisolithus marmoratus]|nr:hypothetical protein EDC04DRAFT_2670018 [Pisolithus marmoratus]
MSNLKTVVDRLKSEKVKERQEGIAALRSTFAREDAVYSIEDGRGWLVLYQALFTTVKVEKLDTVKKSAKAGTAGAAAQRRLVEAAAAVRWLVERSARCLSKRALTPLLDHLLQMLVHRHELFTPIALDYLKTIRVLLSWSPHMDHVNLETWLKLVEICFNVVLGESMDKELLPPGEGSSPEDNSMYQSDSADGNENDAGSSSTPAPTRKRPLVERATPGPADSSHSRRSVRRAVSLEQVECTALLALLFRHPAAPFLATVDRNDPDRKGSVKPVPIAPALFKRMKRFLECYPTDTSLHHDYLLALRSFLSHVSLNCKEGIDDLARSSWDTLVGLWVTKNKQFKESLVGILRILFPFFTATQSGPSYGWADGVHNLLVLLNGEAESRWGIESLSIDSLRLQVSPAEADAGEIFVAHTFRAGCNFDANQALAWSVLELQADCIEKLFKHSESVHVGTPFASTAKRVKREDPICALLQSIRSASTTNVRVYNLQILLFLVDRHWIELHHTLQNDVINVLLQFVSVDDVSSQSWVFLCLAAVARWDGDGVSPSEAVSTTAVHTDRRGPTTWDPIWTHAVRRANVPVVCRAACYAAYLLVGHARHLLTPHRVLAEIETFAKDLDLQGPNFPYDAVCMFLAQCLRVASQDVRLYRMQLEEKVLSWLLENWRIGVTTNNNICGKARLSPHTINDFLNLLGSICGYMRHTDLICTSPLPDCEIAEVMEEQRKTKIIRDYLLSAKLPQVPHRKGTVDDIALVSQDELPSSRLDQALVSPRGRERRVSAFLQKSLESLVVEWEAAKANNSTHPTAEEVRQSLDISIIALIFESLQASNGMRSNRRVIQSAVKVVALLSPLLTDSRWTAEERLLILKAFDPLVLDGDPGNDDEEWEAMVVPGVDSGIRSHVLNSLKTRLSHDVQSHVQRRNLQRMIWGNADIQDGLATVSQSLRQLLCVLIDRVPDHEDSNAEDEDRFGPIRTTHATVPRDDGTQDHSLAIRRLVEICVIFLSVTPALQSPVGEVTRNKELVKVVTDCSEEKLLVLGPPLLTVIRKRFLNLNAHILDTLLRKCAELLQRYSHAFNPQFHLLVTDLLKCTVHVWLVKTVARSTLGDHVLDLCAWISGIARKKVTYWRVRDSVARFMAVLLAEDPSQSFWPSEDEEESISRPLHILLALNEDEDIRVRFRAAAKTAKLFVLREDDGAWDFGDLDSFYSSVHDSLPRDLAKHEHMLTRSLCLGNIMIASSYVRRGPYWHLLEVVFHKPSYARHIQVVLDGVSKRLGLSDSHELFEAYASQIAFSIRQNFYDVLRLPPSLLGYDNRRACAEAAFPLCTPANLMIDGGPDAVAHGRTLFNNHCTAIQKTVSEGLLTCVGDLIGLQLVCFIDRFPGNGGSVTQQLQEILASTGLNFPSQEAFVACVRENVASIAVATIRSLGDQDFSEQGAIVTALRTISSTDAASTFLSLTHYRQMGDFRYHPPNLPRFGTSTVLRSLQWCISFSTREDVAAISFHVLHKLFAELHSTPFVNEQLRLLNGIALLVSVRHRDFDDPTLLHTFVQKSSLLLAQSDLIAAGQSFLQWGFSIFRKTHQVDQKLPNILAHVCALVGDHQTSSSPALTTGGDLRSWLDDQALLLSRDQKIRSFVLKALPAWSHEPSSELSALVEDLSADDLSATLSDHRIASNKFRLVRQLNRHAEQQAYCRIRFSTNDFWRLKDNIPPKERLSRGDIDAFASLLIANAGNIYSFRSEPASSQTLRARHCRGTGRQEDKKTEPAPQHAILQTLLAMLDDNDPSEVNLVYLTLRSLISAASPEILSFQLWSAEYHTPIEYFQRFPVAPNARQTRTIDQLGAISPQNVDFPQWICSVTTLLADILASMDAFYAQLAPLLQRNIAFAEEVLPVLVHTLLQAEKVHTVEVSARKGLSDYFTNVLRAEEVDRLCLRAVVDVILHLRNFEPSGSTDHLAHDKWLDVDFCLLAKSAVTCGSYTTALLFLELACEYQQLNMDATEGIEHVLFDIYSHIDEHDGFYGIKTTDLRHFLIKRFHHEKQWEKAFRFHGAALEAGNHRSIDADGLLQSFHAFGFDHLALRTLQSSQSRIDSDMGSSTMSYQLGWRTDTWDLPDSGQQDSSTTLYRALRAIHRERDSRVVDTAINRALSDMMERLRTLGNEDITEIREVGRNFMCLSQITGWRSGKLQEHIDSKTSDVRVFSHLADIDPDFEFIDLERILATRLSLIRSVRQKEQREQIGELVNPFTQTLIDVEKRCLVRLSVAARKSNQLQVALNSIVKAQQLEKTPSYEISQEFANVLWLQREQKLAVQFLKDLLDQKVRPGSKPTIEEAMTMARLGSWISEACMEKPTDIKQHLFDTAIQVATCAEKRAPTRSDSCASIYHKCAQFAERQYHAILKSPDAVRWKVYVDRKRQEVKQMESQLRGAQMNSHDYNILLQEQTKARALLAEDEDAYEQHNGALATFLESAIDMYSRCLAASDGFDDDVPIRFSSLWFANFDDERLQKVIVTAVDRIPSRKFVFLSHQLSARISRPMHGEAPKSQQILQRLVLRMCQEHPFHSLYQVYCIRPEGSFQSASLRRSSSRLESPTSQTDRGLAACHIFNVLLADSNHSARAKAIEQVCNASLQWAKYPIKDRMGRKTNGTVPESLLIRQLRDIRVPVLTSHPPIDPTLRYDNCIWISHYDATFQTAGGVNMPKINTCYGSNGQRFKQLFKGEGNDDLRQDAVMEQVFELVNTVLRYDRETKRRDLKVRGYTVLPLATQAGLIEFVGNTTPLTSWLQAAHKRYRPNDTDHRQAMHDLRQTREKHKGNTEALVAAFREICRGIQPVMRHYFTEKSKTPVAWFAMRLNYTRSVATTSIVGHVLGLGDRHISNILLDNGSGEVVHIDLGIAFDQGKRLAVPERVPFRMTRDMVDGMGYSGTQGVFQRCAEETLRVLREQSDVVMTVLEVFKHDPLHSWTASELKLKRIQESTMGPLQRLDPLAEPLDFDMKSGSAEAAERALRSVARKLDKSLSVEYTVNELIAEAKDIVNLATIYYGWSPDL